MLGAGLSCCKASCHAAGHEAQVLPFRTISEKCGVRSEDCLDGPRSFFPRFVSLNWGLGRRGQAPGVAGAASRPARADDSKIRWRLKFKFHQANILEWRPGDLPSAQGGLSPPF